MIEIKEDIEEHNKGLRKISNLQILHTHIQTLQEGVIWKEK